LRLQTKFRNRLVLPVRTGSIVRSLACAIAIAFVLSTVGFAETVKASPIEVTVAADGGKWLYTTSQKTVGSMLKEAGVTLGAEDMVSPKLGAKLAQGMRIRVTRVTSQVLAQKEPIKFRTIVKFNPLGNSERQVLIKGVPGNKEVTYKAVYKDGVKVSCKIVGAKVLSKPVHEVVAISKATFLASRAGSYMRSMHMIATAYEPYNCGGSGSGRTASGLHAGKGVVAVDPRVIPLGTRLYVEGYGFCIAGDTGGDIKGARIDLGYDTYREAIQFGRRAVTVYVLD
jgi:3D (Asp-Asp-Asp) domain-containing protein